MKELIELLQQIQELAGVGIDALKGAGKGPDEGPKQEAPAPEGAPQEGKGGGRPPFEPRA